MSVPVDLADLARQAAGHPFAYLLTVGDNLRSHAVAVSPMFDEHGMVVTAGGRTTANALARPDVALVFPPAEAGGYSLIVDAHASSSGAEATDLRLVPLKAVLHRPAPADHAPEPGGCAHDCRPVGG